ncbi:unnamed protein product [Ixodes hexagonus]
MAASKESILLIRGVLRELRKALPGVRRNFRFYRYKIFQIGDRRHDTDRKCIVSRGHCHVNAVFSVCLCGSADIRYGQELQQQYHGRKERSVEESARLVGLAMPKPPGETKDC